jgi:hypothetical protein
MIGLSQPLNTISGPNPNIYNSVEAPTVISPFKYITNQRGISKVLSYVRNKGNLTLPRSEEKLPHCLTNSVNR